MIRFLLCSMLPGFTVKAIHTSRAIPVESLCSSGIVEAGGSGRCLRLLSEIESGLDREAVDKTSVLGLALDEVPLEVTEEFLSELERRNREIVNGGSDAMGPIRRRRFALVESISHRLGMPPLQETKLFSANGETVSGIEWITNPPESAIRRFIAEARVKLKEKEAEEAALPAPSPPGAVSEAELPRPAAPLAASEPSASEPAESGSLLFRIAAAFAAVAAGVWVWMRKRGN